MTAQTSIPRLPRFRFPAFTDSANLRLLMGTLLYLAQGITQGVFWYTIPTWLAVSGQPAAAVGAVGAAAALPWSLKFILGGLIDRYTFLPMGRRRAWLVFAQTMIALLFVLAATISPLPSEVALITVWVVTISTFTALQDVALDAMVIDLTPDGELGKVNGFMFAGKLAGIAGGMAIISYVIEYHGFSAGMLVAMGLFAVPAIAAILIRERPGERYLPWTSGAASAESISAKVDAWLPLFKDTVRSMMRRDVLFVVALSLFYGIHQGIFETSTTLFAANELGWTATQASSFSASLNIVGAVIALTIGGWATDKFGPGRIALSASGLTAITIAALIAGDAYWQNPTFYMVWYLLAFPIVTFFYLSMLTLGMRVCEAHVAATSYALIAGCMALGLSIGSGSIGWLEEVGGFYAMFGAAAALIVLSGSMTLGLSRRTGGPIMPEENAPHNAILPKASDIQ